MLVSEDGEASPKESAHGVPKKGKEISLRTAKSYARKWRGVSFRCGGYLWRMKSLSRKWRETVHWE